MSKRWSGGTMATMPRYPVQAYLSYLHQISIENDNKVLLLFNLVKPDAFKDDNNVVLLFKVLSPLTFKVPKLEVLLFNVADQDI